MEIVIALGFLLGGFFFLVLGGDWLVKAAVSISARTKIDAATIGLTVIAAGTSAPELVTSLLAAFKGAPDIAVGNVVGSNIFNILAIIGIASLIKPNKVAPSAVKIELPFLIFTALLMYAFGLNNLYSRVDGIIMILALAAFIIYSLRKAKQRGMSAADIDEEIEILKSGWHDIGYLVLGFVGLLGGADLALRGGIQIGELAGLSERVIGITIISVGTGLPELVTSAVAAYKGRDDIAVANVLGSNMMNTMAIIGATSVTKPIPVSEKILEYDFFWMIGATVILMPIFLIFKRKIGRTVGAFLLIIYLGYVTSLLLSK